MTIVEDRIVLSVSLLDLVERLRDQKRLDAVACHEGERAFEEVETAERWKLVEHQQQSLRDPILRARSSVRRRPSWLRMSRISGLVRLMSDGGTTR